MYYKRLMLNKNKNIYVICCSNIPCRKIDIDHLLTCHDGGKCTPAILKRTLATNSAKPVAK